MRWLAAVSIAAALVTPALAQTGGGTDWGLRLGFASDPDQVVGGFQFDAGQVAPQMRVRPAFEIGLGDDHTVVQAAVPLHYFFKPSGNMTPYVGAGIVVAYIDHDHPGHDDESDVEFGGQFIGGLEWKLSGANRFGVELDLGVGDIHNAELVASWWF